MVAGMEQRVVLGGGNLECHVQDLDLDLNTEEAMAY